MKPDAVSTQPPERRHGRKEGARKGVEHTNDEADFTLLVVIATGHHGPHCVIHHSHNVGIIILGTDYRVSLSTHMWEQSARLKENEVSITPTSPGVVLLSSQLVLTLPGSECSDSIKELHSPPTHPA